MTSSCVVALRTATSRFELLVLETLAREMLVWSLTTAMAFRSLLGMVLLVSLPPNKNV